ncbi:MAG: TlpA family protein disulfide reductase [Gemmataceae bacterium]
MNVTLDGIDLGQPVMGRALSPDELNGKVVLVHFWGADASPSLPDLPHLTTLSESYAPFGLVVVGVHVRPMAQEQMKTKAKLYGISYPVTAEGRIKDGNDFKYIPHCILFGASGKCIYRGATKDIDARILAALGSALTDHIGGKPTKALTQWTDGLRKGQPPATLVQKAVTLSKSPEADTAAQAKTLVGHLTELAEREIKDIEALRADDPITVLPRLTRLSTDFKGLPPGAGASHLLAEWKKDKAVSAELKARPLIENIRELDAALQAALADGDPKSPDFQRSQAGTLNRLKNTIQQLKRTAADAPSTKAALEIAGRYGISVK